MPIQKLLATGEFTAEQQNACALAFHSTLGRLGLVDRNDPLCEMIARKIIEIEASGTGSAAAITELALKHFQA